MGKRVSSDYHLNPGELWENPLERPRCQLPASIVASVQPWEPLWKVPYEFPLECIHSWCEFHMEGCSQQPHECANCMCCLT